MRRSPQNPLASLGRFSETGLNILVAVSSEPRHAYDMLVDIEARTGSSPGPGTLYAAIAELEARRWIEPLESDDPRRPYQITPDGQQALRAQLAIDAAASRLATERLADA